MPLQWRYRNILFLVILFSLFNWLLTYLLVCMPFFIMLVFANFPWYMCHYNQVKKFIISELGRTGATDLIFYSASWIAEASWPENWDIIWNMFCLSTAIVTYFLYKQLIDPCISHWNPFFEKNYDMVVWINIWLSIHIALRHLLKAIDNKQTRTYKASPKMSTISGWSEFLRKGEPHKKFNNNFYYNEC